MRVAVKPGTTVLYLPVNGPPEKRPHPKSLKEWQTLLGGEIERGVIQDYEYVCREVCGYAGQNEHMPTIYGPVVICRRHFHPLRDPDYEKLETLGLRVLKENE